MIIINGHDVTGIVDFAIGMWSGWCLAQIVRLRAERRAKR